MPNMVKMILIIKTCY